MIFLGFHHGKMTCTAIVLIVASFSACQEKKESGAASGGGEPYYHPSVATAPTTNTTTSQSRSTTADLSLTEDVVLQLGTTKVTIPAGAIHEEGTATLQSYTGPFVNTSAMRMVTDASLLVLRKVDATDFARTDVYKDILIEQVTTAKSTAAKLVQLFQEDANLSTASKKGLTQKAIATYYTDLGGGKYQMNFHVRPPRLGFVVAETNAGVLPTGFDPFIEPPKDPTVLTGVTTSPADVTLSWSGDPRFNATYGVVYAASGTAVPDCTYQDTVEATTSSVITSVTTSADYTYSITDLLDGTAYTFRVCGQSTRSEADSSYGSTVTITTPNRAHAVLTDTPNNPSNTTALNVTVGGANVVQYQYALLVNQASCSGATLSDWIDVTTAITDAVPQSTGDELRLCVYAKIDDTNVQLVPTEYTWTVDKTPPVFTSLALVAPALDGYLSSADRVLTTVIAGALAATDYDETQTSYRLVTAATVCDSSLVYGAAPAADSSNITVDGSYKICVHLADEAGNTAYGSSANFTVDTTIAFTAANLANQAADTYINLADNALTGNLVAAATGVGFTTAQYVLVTAATTCNSSLTYLAAIPRSNNAFFTVDGDYKVCVDLFDLAGNHAYGSSATIHLKKTVPAFTAMALANAAADTWISATEHALTSDLSTTATGTSYDTLVYTLTTAATSCSAAVGWGASIPHADHADISVDGELYKICARFTDNAANPAAFGNTASFTYDITPPVFTSLPLLNGATDSYLNSAEMAAALAIHDVAVGSGSTAEAYALASSATSCDGSLTYGLPAILANSTDFAADGDYKVCVRMNDAAGNLTYGGSAAFTKITSVPDCSAIALANHATDAWINLSENGTSLVLSGAATTALGSPVRTYALIAAAATCDGSATFGATDVLPLSDDAGLVDGSSYKICASVTDNGGNTPAYCATATFTVDKTPPVFTALPLANTAADSYVNIADHALTSDVAGPITASGQTSVGYVLVSAATTCDGLLTYGATIPVANDSSLGTDGSYKVCVKLLDAANNDTYGESSAFTSDQIAPIFTSIDLASEATGGYINLAESASGLDAAANLVASGETSTEYATQTSAGACSAASYGATIPTVAAVAGLGDGTYKICVHMLDVAGNETYGSSSGVRVDVTVPSFASLALANDAVDTYINLAERSLTTAVVSAATGTGFDQLVYALVADGTACSGVGVWAAPLPKANSGDFGADGDYIVCVKMTDYAGNPDAFGASPAIHLKTDFPIFTSLDLAGEVVDSFLSANEHTQNSALGSNLAASGQTATGYVLTADATTCNGSLTYGAMPLADSGVLSGQGDFKICVSLTDIAGNVTYGSSASFTYDPTAPVFTSIALLNDASDGFLNATEHATNNALGGSLSASGYSAATYVVVTSATTCDALLTYGAMPLSDEGSLSDAATWKLCVKLVDAAGNITYGSGSTTFVTDFVAPAFTAVSLTGTVSDGYVNDGDATGASNLVTAATGTGFDTAQYAVTTAATTCDGALTYNATIPKTNAAAFSSDGSYKVCAKLIDDAGNVPAYGASATLVRDVTKPTSTVSTSGTILPTTTAGQNTTISGTATDAVAGVAAVDISIQEGSGSCYDASANDFSATCPAWIAATGTTSWSYDIGDEVLMKGVVYTIQSRATDAAVATGNIQSSFGSSTFTFSATEGDDLWSAAKTFDSGADDRPTAAALDSSGHVYIVGWHTVSDKNWMIKKFDKRGNEDTTQWNKDVGDVGADEIARGVAIDSSNNVYVVGSRYNGSHFDWWLKKYDATGSEDLVNWDAIVDGGTGDDEAMSVAVDSTGNVYVVGYGTNIVGGASCKDIWIRKFSSNGSLACEQKLDGGANLADEALSVAVNSATGKFFVAGYQTLAGPDQQMVVRRLRTNDCSIEATASGNSAGNSDQAMTVRLDSTGAVYVAGRDSSTDADWWIRKYSANLALQSDFNPVVAGLNEALALAIDVSDNVYVGGLKTNGTQDGWLRQFTTTLVEDTVQWNKVLDESGQSDQITAIAIGAGADDVGSVYVIGWGTDLVSGTSGIDWWIRKYAGP